MVMVGGSRKYPTVNCHIIDLVFFYIYFVVLFCFVLFCFVLFCFVLFCFVCFINILFQAVGGDVKSCMSVAFKGAPVDWCGLTSSLVGTKVSFVPPSFSISLSFSFIFPLCFPSPFFLLFYLFILIFKLYIYLWRVS